MTNDKGSAAIKSQLAAVNWELPGMEKFSKDDITFFKREICNDATYALSSYGHKAQAALAALQEKSNG
jgi:hypothetical protein